MRKVGKTLSLVMVFVIVLSLVGCGTSNDSDNQENSIGNGSNEKVGGKLVIYSAIYDYNYNLIVDAFTEKYGIEVEAVQAGAGELKTRIKAEAGNPQGDIMFGGLQYPDYLDFPNLWEPYVSVNNDKLPPQFQNTTGSLTWMSAQIVNLLVNKELVSDLGIEIKGYKDLLQPELKGKIISSDPAASSSAWRQLTTMLVVLGNGDYESEEGWGYIEDLVKNLDGVMTSSSSAVYKGVFEGEYVVGLTYEAPCVTYIEEGFDDIVEIVYMEEGTTISPFATAIIKGAKNVENAKLFIDFLTSDEGQSLWAKSTARQVNTYLPTANEVLIPLDNIKFVDEDLDYIAVNREAILERFASIWAKYN